MSPLDNDAIAALHPVVSAFGSLRIRYYVGGSLASAMLGVARATLDADVVADVRLEHVEPLAQALESQYYLDRDAIREAIRRRGSFNFIFLPRTYKVDVFILKSDDFDQESLARAKPAPIFPGDPSSVVPFLSPEDSVLHKLRWYRMGQEVSDRQWLDVVTLMKVQGGRLDSAYLDRWAPVLAIADLLARARRAAGE
jgi:hypothetical protein